MISDGPRPQRDRERARYPCADAVRTSSSLYSHSSLSPPGTASNCGPVCALRCRCACGGDKPADGNASLDTAKGDARLSSFPGRDGDAGAARFFPRRATMPETPQAHGPPRGIFSGKSSKFIILRVPATSRTSTYILGALCASRCGRSQEPVIRVASARSSARSAASPQRSRLRAKRRAHLPRCLLAASSASRRPPPSP